MAKCLAFFPRRKSGNCEHCRRNILTTCPGEHFRRHRIGRRRFGSVCESHREDAMANSADPTSLTPIRRQQAIPQTHPGDARYPGDKTKPEMIQNRVQRRALPPVLPLYRGAYQARACVRRAGNHLRITHSLSMLLMSITSGRSITTAPGKTSSASRTKLLRGLKRCSQLRTPSLSTIWYAQAATHPSRGTAGDRHAPL